MEQILNLLYLCGLVVLVYVTLGYIVALLIKRNDIADVMWGPGIALSAWTATLLSPLLHLEAFIICVLITIWALRLSLHIGVRFFTKKEEDRRYAAWRSEWGKTGVWRSFLQVFLLQGLLMIVVGYGAIHASVFGVDSISVLLLLGALVWLVGFLFETVADAQLKAFLSKQENKGKIMTTGVWSLSRHPNYFGEVTLWWGIWLMVASLSWSVFALISPVMITFLILKVSGIPMLEKGYEGNAEFDEYKKRTSAFFPIPKIH